LPKKSSGCHKKSVAISFWAIIGQFLGKAEKTNNFLQNKMKPIKSSYWLYNALDAHIVWLYDGFAVSVPPQAIVVRGSLTIFEKSSAKAASLFVHPPTATDRI
jgi:hypothetical protein